MNKIYQVISLKENGFEYVVYETPIEELCLQFVKARLDRGIVTYYKIINNSY